MAFIGLEIPVEIAKVLSELVVPGEKCNALEYHITLAHFEIDKKDPASLAEYVEPLFNVTDGVEPFEIELKSLSFFKSDDETVPIILLVDSPELKKLQKNLTKELDKLDLEFSKKFKTFVPHVSLSYCNKEENEKFLGNLPLSLNPKLSWQVQEIIMWGGKQNKQTAKFHFPLTFEINGLEKLVAKGENYMHLTSMVKNQNMKNMKVESAIVIHPEEPKDTRKAFGYWNSKYYPDLPDPKDLIDDNWNKQERIKVANYLNQGKKAYAYKGSSYCRICGKTGLGSRCLTNDEFVYPEGLSHYIMEHSVKVPEQLLKQALLFYRNNLV